MTIISWNASHILVGSSSSIHQVIITGIIQDFTDSVVCPFCKAFSPIYNAEANKAQAVKFAVVNCRDELGTCYFITSYNLYYILYKYKINLLIILL
jgi:hypothetical protein